MDLKFNEFIIPDEEKEENFQNCTVTELLRPIPQYIPMDIPYRRGRPQNIDQSRHWNPLALFQLFFTWEIMEIICQQTNSYAYRTNSKAWKGLTVIELYQFFGMLLTIAL